MTLCHLRPENSWRLAHPAGPTQLRVRPASPPPGPPRPALSSPKRSLYHPNHATRPPAYIDQAIVSNVWVRILQSPHREQTFHLVAAWHRQLRQCRSRVRACLPALAIMRCSQR
eukprot:scaffold296889_cov26-Tisochrysis_lutea.AAC.3